MLLSGLLGRSAAEANRLGPLSPPVGLPIEARARVNINADQMEPASGHRAAKFLGVLERQGAGNFPKQPRGKRNHDERSRRTSTYVGVRLLRAARVKGEGHDVTTYHGWPEQGPG